MVSKNISKNLTIFSAPASLIILNTQFQFLFSMISIPYGVIHNNQEGVQNTNGLLNTLVIQIFYFAICNVLYVLPEELPILVQEVADGLYSPLAYYLSKILFLVSSNFLWYVINYRYWPLDSESPWNINYNES